MFHRVIIYFVNQDVYKRQAFAKTDSQEKRRMIDQVTIDRILDAAQIMDVVSDFVTPVSYTHLITKSGTKG